MADKTKIKKVKMKLVLDHEEREQLIAMLRGECECVSLEHVCFEHFEIDELKSDCCKVEGIECDRGKIKCLKLSVYQPEC